MRTDIDEATIAEARRLWKLKEKTWVIAEQVGLTSAEVVELCDHRLRSLARREAKVAEELAKLPKRVARIRKAIADDANEEEIRRLWSAGATGRSLASQFGMAPSKVSGIVADLPRPVRYADPEAAPRLPPLPKPPAGPPDPADLLIAEPSVRGSRHGRSVLDEEKVAEMRRLRSRGWSTGRLAERYGVGRNTICYAISGRTWGHVGADPGEGVNHAD